MPIKSEWVVAPHEGVAWQSHDEIKTEIKVRFERDNAPMIWRKNTNNEYEKIFVVWW
jgi:hypothetical protein